VCITVHEMGLKLSRKNIAENLCEVTTTYNIPLYLEWNIDKYIKSEKIGLLRGRFIYLKYYNYPLKAEMKSITILLNE